jgi:hypothetical protein
MCSTILELGINVNVRLSYACISSSFLYILILLIVFTLEHSLTDNANC